MEYRDYDDKELLSYIAEANEEANNILFKKYEPLIKKYALKMYKFCMGSGLEVGDLNQEGMIGLNLAINSFNQNKDTSFYTYAKTCVERRIMSFVIGNRRQKHRPLNEALSFDLDEETDFGLEKVIGDNRSNPEVMFINNERETELISKVNELLTDLEKQVFELKISNFNYKEIAEILDKSPKAIDNALQRIKLKFKNLIKQD